MLLFLVIFQVPQAIAQVDAAYTQQKDTALLIGQKVQEQLGLGSGYTITELRGVSLISPRFEISLRLRMLSHFGNLLPNNLALTGPNRTEIFSVAGVDRPSIRARQLVYGDFKNGRWYILDLGLGFFNISGYAPEPFRFWSARIALHESLYNPILSPQFEVGVTMRSRTDTVQSTSLALIYPPTIDLSAGLHKEWNEKFYAAIDFKLDQALTSQTIAGIYDTNTVQAFKTPTVVVGLIEAGWHIDFINSVFMRLSDRMYAWPNDNNSMIWNFFEEGYFGRSFSVYWRGQW